MPGGERFIFSRREVGGACGDLGTLFPLMLACIAVAGLAPIPVVLGFAAFYIATAVVYRLPLPVQPMKPVAAVALSPGGTALLAIVPLAGLGVLLLIAALELALSRRLFDCRPSCWPVIALTAALTLWADPFWGLLTGSLVELGRRALLRRWLADPGD